MPRTQSGEFSANNGLPGVPEMEELEKLKLEKELLGFSFLSSGRYLARTGSAP